jgi:hypothetical protein
LPLETLMPSSLDTAAIEPPLIVTVPPSTPS